MPVVPFDSLPDSARCWVFVADTALTATAAAPLLDAVDAHLAGWAAHGVPLVCARAWVHDRFLVIGVDEAATGASGCSIDALFRTIGAVQGRLGVDLLASGRVAWRAQDRQIVVSGRDDFEALALQGAVLPTSPIFDTLAETVGAWRHRREVPAAESWAAALLP
ncbi:MAG: hypothetical protein MUF40_05730 [Gemmatimonadaceae bacterium]|jgi:hypothetical protein|nr:hypothetical protein [Gemmatimonadaceae bacterium]